MVLSKNTCQEGRTDPTRCLYCTPAEHYKFTWQGVRGMRIGGQRKLIVPPELAYGKKGIGEVPPDATLEFEARLYLLACTCAIETILQHSKLVS